ncbi:hypothetical protein TIFTF001_005214 [Ficus carica]|uniref:Uncharacterized protein n=1 Tax=Ficus carica TaxID=3494 RepID=A0AA88A0S6_FICCA|nr:hypothetical protein TIFTF001_005214 [Ficus carica]
MSPPVKLRAWPPHGVQLRPHWRVYGKFGGAGRMVHEWFGVKGRALLFFSYFDEIRDMGNPKPKSHCRAQ